MISSTAIISNRIILIANPLSILMNRIKELPYHHQSTTIGLSNLNLRKLVQEIRNSKDNQQSIYQ